MMKLYTGFLTTSNIQEIRIKAESPWYTGELRRHKAEKQRSENKWLQSKKAEDFEILKGKRLMCRNKCDLAKREYYTQNFCACLGGQKKLFRPLKTLCGASSCKDIAGETSDKEIAEEIKRYFIDKIYGIRSDILVKQKSIGNLESFKTCNVSLYKKQKVACFAELPHVGEQSKGSL